MLAFIQIPETVGPSFESILRRSYRLGHCNVLVPKNRRAQPILSAGELTRCRRIFPQLSSISGQAVTTIAGLQKVEPGIRFYTFLREPTERCVAEYVRMVTRPGQSPQQTPFEEWIRTPMVRNRQCRQICGTGDSTIAIEELKRSVSFVGLIERFHESLVMFGRWSENPKIDVRYHLRRPTCESQLKRQLTINLQSRRLLIEANREDGRLYDFVVREVFPNQQEEYGDRLAMDVQAFEAFNIPPNRFPRETLNLVYRELAYRPLMPFIADKKNPPIVIPTTPLSTIRRAA